MHDRNSIETQYQHGRENDSGERNGADHAHYTRKDACLKYKHRLLLFQRSLRTKTEAIPWGKPQRRDLCPNLLTLEMGPRGLTGPQGPLLLAADGLLRGSTIIVERQQGGVYFVNSIRFVSLIPELFRV
jgi:hypothetical protein